MTLTILLLAGGLVGLGVLLLALVVTQPQPSGPVALAQFEAERGRQRRAASLVAQRSEEAESLRMRTFGSRVAEWLERQGISLPGSLSAALSMTGQSREFFLARVVLGAVLGFLLPPIVLSPMVLLGLFDVTTPLWLSLIGAALGVVLPYLTVLRKAEERRRGFRHVVSSFLDLVAMNLAGGRGVPEALQGASGISDGWAMVRLRDTLEAARLQGSTPWAALGQLGDEVNIDELRDLSAALALVAEDGAKVRDSLTARATSMRHRELADAEGRAAARSQSMLVAQLLLCIGFLLFLLYPAVARILG